MSANLYDLFLSRFKGEKDKPCLVVPGGPQISYEELDELSARFAALLKQKGLEPGARVVVQVDKSIGAVALYLACLRVGAVFVPLNTAYTASEVSFFLGDAAPHLFVCRPEDKAALLPVAEEKGIAQIASLGTSANEGLWQEALGIEPSHQVIARERDDLAAILYTSGTTGRSKGAMLSHENLSSNALTLHKIWGFQRGDVLLHALPIFHVHGLFIALHCAFLNASKVIFLPRFDVNEVRAHLKQASVMMGVPTFYTRLLEQEDFGADECAAMRLFISGSAPMIPQTFEAFEARTGHKILERYGMSEAGMITSNPLEGERLAGTVGFALPGVSVRVADEEGRLCSAGEVGTVEMSGSNLFKGYWQLPEKTAAEFRHDGFFITGDLGSLDEEGRLTLVGRGKDLIISGGYNIYPKEIELCIDDVEGVAESAVIGVPDADFGEAVMAVVVCEAKAAITPEDILQQMQDKLARFKQPRRIEFVDALPRNAMGKVQKNKLREDYGA